MTVSTAPIFTGTPQDDWGFAASGGATGSDHCSAASTGVDLTTGTPYQVCVAGANGGLLRGLTVKANPGNNTAASVMRVWLNNGSAVSTAKNSVLIGEQEIPATTASNSSANPDLFWAPAGGDRALAPGHTVYVTFGTAAGGSGSWAVSADFGSYAAQ